MVLTEDIIRKDRRERGTDLGTVRVAYFLSTRELAGERGGDEKLSATGDPAIDGPINASHRGNLPMVVERLRNYNRMAEASGCGPRIEISLIVVDDVEVMRDFSDLGIPVHQEPSTYPDARKTVTIERVKSCMSRRERELTQTDVEWREVIRRHKASAVALAKDSYERRLLNQMEEHGIDIIISDRYMRIFGPTFLSQFLGLIINSHPAILPEIPGNIPTSGALDRAARHGHMWTGITCHIIDEGEDTGPAILQKENVRIMPEEIAGGVENQARLRRRNYENEGQVLASGLVQYLSDPRVMQLIRSRRQFVTANGNRGRILESMQELGRLIVNSYRETFDSFYPNHKDEKSRTVYHIPPERSIAGAGRYRYCFGRQAMRQSAKTAVYTPPRTPLRRTVTTGGC
jgi:folate-dependent phosphoribosylglycinamide formyltransferase PurN